MIKCKLDYSFLLASQKGCLIMEKRGVELGKVLAKRILGEYSAPDAVMKNHDSSTAGLIGHYLANRK